ncbi:zinc finger protein 830 [Mixophyes fleayi]|uniref:zinc finger protein 830 n=1 Tax=Mixophyes fleayi TaxID=3061075 RepID=UPI003F4D8CA7
MAAHGKKKLVQQEELRRLMKAKQRSTSARKRIESPLAKYNNIGHLSCIVCNVQIKNELLWQAHILGKQHKEKVADLKGATVNTSSPSIPVQRSQATKRKSPNPEGNDSKRIKDSEEQSATSSTTSMLPVGFFENTDQQSHKQITVNPPNLRLLPGVYDDDDDGEEDEDGETVSAYLSSLKKVTDMPLPPPSAHDRTLPTDFFESKASLVSHSGSILKADLQEKPVEKKENTAEALPEGFFDDPEVDAKVRKVDAPKDQLDKEWEEFQKEIRQVNTVSEAIVAEEDEEGRLDRQIDEIDEQIECYRRIEHLRNRKDDLHDVLIGVMKSKTSEEEEEDVEMLPIMLTQNWREKGAFL